MVAEGSARKKNIHTHVEKELWVVACLNNQKSESKSKVVSGETGWLVAVGEATEESQGSEIEMRENEKRWREWGRGKEGKEEAEQSLAACSVASLSFYKPLFKYLYVHHVTGQQ